MLLAITEYNAWENERWTYVLDLEKQDGEVINELMIFIRCANLKFEEIKNASSNRLFAASRYGFKFYKQLDLSGRMPHLKNSKSGLIMNGGNGYNSNLFDLKVVLSSRKVHSAMIAMRDRGENLIYKAFDSFFLKVPAKQTA